MRESQSDIFQQKHSRPQIVFSGRGETRIVKKSNIRKLEKNSITDFCS